MFAVLLGDGKSAGPTHLQMPVAPPCQPIRSLGLAAAAGPNMRRHWGGGRWRRVPCGLSLELHMAVSRFPRHVRLP
jgi:hypothetical protein